MSTAETEPEGVMGPYDQDLRVIIDTNKKVIAQLGVVNDHIADIKAAKKDLREEQQHLATLQGRLNSQVYHLAKKREANEPDPSRFPLFDRPAQGDDARAAVSGMFPKPEAIPPRADTLEQFQTILSRSKRLADLDLGKRLLTKLEGKGVTTVAHLQGKSKKELDLTDRQQDELDTALALFWDACDAEWKTQSTFASTNDDDLEDDPDDDEDEE